MNVPYLLFYHLKSGSTFMRYFKGDFLLLLSLCLISHIAFAQSGLPSKGFGRYFLIAHRGGVVDSTNAENSLPALQDAIERGYWMVEMDLRLTRDSVLIIHHDPDFKRYYGVEKAVSAMTWDEISQLRSARGNQVMKLEDALSACSGKIQVMLDNKISGNDTLLFSQVVSLLQKYGLDKQALMIGTDESTDYFTGKIKLSCTRQQLEINTQKPGYSPEYYYLFGETGSMTDDDVKWAQYQGIMVVGVLNMFRYKGKKGKSRPYLAAARDATRLKSLGVQFFQLDSEFDRFFR
ncbi:glycerophosphodiester phosphodiesterase family protein [Chitinophaga agrisoli]|uniref:Glycerophosphodiester phosphodiesterase family protein n=1 Tax=Chitinophaga agrisoli TaxID=2607653 RepID=A0A5B2VV38_9BACT|nr:glycerophosphodiester phosphodiesterase family protein [Chitinophaga agrisoli]